MELSGWGVGVVCSKAGMYLEMQHIYRTRIIKNGSQLATAPQYKSEVLQVFYALTKRSKHFF